MNLLIAISIITTILIVWNLTDFVYEYFNFKPINKLLKLDVYEEEGFSLEFTYQEFLLIKYNSFFTRLLDCPYCHGLWLSIFTIPFVGWSFLIVYLSSLLLYFTIKKLSI